MQLKFVESKLGNLSGKEILDIGCATGELAFNLTEKGAKVTGIDLNEDLLNQAKSNRMQAGLQFQVGDMLELENDFQQNQFDSVLCFGNTLVHLQSISLIEKMLNGVKSILNPRGQFLMQILNYDYILNEKVSELPLIETENIRFVRNYKFNVNSALIRFQTDLYLKKEDQTVSNETSLFAIGSPQLLDILDKCGFKSVELYADFKQSPFGGKHIPLVLKAEVM
jgi:glycine/sarcosine N-methyltransferase